MKKRPDKEDRKLLIDYWSMAATPHGRAAINTRRFVKIFVWRAVIDGSLFLKRSLDIVVAVLTLLVWLAPLLIVMALIKLEDRGPIFFRQMRIGLRGRPFAMWKFRSMGIGADKMKDQLLEKNEMAGGVTFKMKNDPRVTRVGRFIRKYSVDEVPQLWNVLLGDMSFVGPRPPVPREVAQYSPEDRQRLLAKPGLTCVWQVSGRSNIDFPGQVRLDLQYIRSQSLWLDVTLLLKTIPAVLFGDGAY